MKPWRLRIAWIVLVGGLTPAILAYTFAMFQVRSNPAAASCDVQTPNPPQTPNVELGPVETLMFLDPTWAGTATIWLGVSGVLVVVLAVVAAALWPPSASARALLVLRLVSFVAGLPLAWPWLSVLLRA